MVRTRIRARVRARAGARAWVRARCRDKYHRELRRNTNQLHILYYLREILYETKRYQGLLQVIENST